MKRIALSALLIAASLVAPPPSATAAAEPIPDGAVVDQFDGTTLGEDWTVLSPDSSRWSLSGGALRVESLTGDTARRTGRSGPGKAGPPYFRIHYGNFGDAR
ncbi:hypothetical protein [Nonomuraea jabiensis]|uniref:3-keto-disaccharide hydrolase domain-containing protein n=1 Tax=Nonomuraea jabiensis TaxID=882448 RepID=A0A7W9GK98_9ACTN|nr:hypothetical protein [Nonomuraea jabiensis]MBB5785340.1 hypothetical protein [Nonomuraea jabiensis]